MDSQLVSRSGP